VYDGCNDDHDCIARRLTESRFFKADKLAGSTRAGRKFADACTIAMVICVHGVDSYPGVCWHFCCMSAGQLREELKQELNGNLQALHAQINTHAHTSWRRLEACKVAKQPTVCYLDGGRTDDGTTPAFVVPLDQIAET
jgi:hypothetical protein